MFSHICVTLSISRLLAYSTWEKRVQRRVSVFPLPCRWGDGRYEFQKQAVTKWLQAYWKHRGQELAGKWIIYWCSPLCKWRRSKEFWPRSGGEWMSSVLWDMLFPFPLQCQWRSSHPIFCRELRVVLLCLNGDHALTWEKRSSYSQPQQHFWLLNMYFMGPQYGLMDDITPTNFPMPNECL